MIVLPTENGSDDLEELRIKIGASFHEFGSQLITDLGFVERDTIINVEKNNNGIIESVDFLLCHNSTKLLIPLWTTMTL